MLKYIVFIGIIYTAAAVLKISKHNGKDKSVNVALETVLEFDKENKQRDVNILNKFHKFIGKVKNAIETNNIKRRSMGSNKKDIFTHFILNLIKSLLKYEDTDLETFVSIISKEINDYRHKDTTFYEFTESIDYHNFLKHKLNKIKIKPAQDIRIYLKHLARKIEEDNLERDEKELWNTIKSIYSEDTIPKCNEFIRNVDNYGLKARKTNDLYKIVSGGLKTLLFNVYSNLDSNVKRKIRNYLTRLQDKKLQSKLHKQTTSETRIMIDQYVDIKELQKSYKYWLKDLASSTVSTTLITRRPHNVPTKKFKSAKKGKLSKSNIDTYTYKKQDRKTTKELRTLRQMYVEKNIDLKYDPDAYEHLTTHKHRNQKTIDPHSSITRHRKKHKKSESILRNMKSVHGSKESEISDNESESKYKSKAKNIRNDQQELYAIEPRHPNIIKLVKDIDYTIEVKKAADFDWSDDKPYKQNSRSKKKNDTDYKTNKNHESQAARFEAPSIPNLRRQNRRSSEVNLKISRAPLVQLRQCDTTHNGRRQVFRRRFTESPIISEEDGMSLEGFDGRKHRKHFRRSEDLVTTVSVSTDNYILGRIQKLESELEKVKGKIIGNTNVKESNKRNETSESHSEESNISNDSKLDIEFQDQGNSNIKDENDPLRTTRNTKPEHISRKNNEKTDLGTFEVNHKYNKKAVHSSFDNYKNTNENKTRQNQTDLDNNSTHKVINFKINNNVNERKLNLTETTKNEIKTITSTVASRNPNTDNSDKSLVQSVVNRTIYRTNNDTTSFKAEESTTTQLYNTGAKDINTGYIGVVFKRTRDDDEITLMTNETSTESSVRKPVLFAADNITASNKTVLVDINKTILDTKTTISHKITSTEVVEAKLASLSNGNIDKKGNGKSEGTEVVIPTQKSVNDTSPVENNQTSSTIMLK